MVVGCPDQANPGSLHRIATCKDLAWHILLPPEQEDMVNALRDAAASLILW
jgi:hypothetical protein